jgi:hypothetical protein
MYLIKRYANGRFYDTVEKKYITRQEIAEMFDAGESLSIIDTRTAEDVTHSVLTGIDAERDFIDATAETIEGVEPEEAESVMSQLFRIGEGLFGDYKKRYDSLRQNLAGMSRDEIDRLLTALRRDTEKKTEGIKKEAGSAREEFDRFRKGFQDWVVGRIDRRLDEALRKMNLADRDQIEELSAKIDELRIKFEKLERDAAQQARENTLGRKDDDISI